jgi:hypothetical protein
VTAKIRKRKANLMKLVEPAFLSLVTSPANKTAFKIVRSAQDTVSAEPSLLAIEFPPGITRDEAERLMGVLNLGEDYVLVEGGNTGYYLQRAGVADEVLAASPFIAMGNGFAAAVSVQNWDSTHVKSITGVKLLRMEFASSQYTLEQVKQWLEDNDIDFQSNGVSQTESCTVVVRHDSRGEEHTVQIMPGIVGYVSRAAANDVPNKVYRQVIESAYGTWGWGQLDFRAALADPEFSEESMEAIYVLGSVLDRIILSSGLPLSERKSLMRMACEQFADYMDGLMDALPTSLIEQARSDQTKQEIMQMPSERKDEEKKDETVARQEAAETPSEATETTPNETSEEENTEGGEAAATVTRDEVEKMVRDALAESQKTFTEFIETLRAEYATRKPEQNEADPKDTGAFGEMLKDITDKVERMSESLSTVKKELEEFSGTTISRSSAGDVNPDEAEVKRSENVSPFKGIFGSRPFNL